MEPLYIEATKLTPKVILDKNKEIYQIIGRPLPENAVSFYVPIMEWLKDYFKNPNKSTTITFELEYANSTSSKNIFEIICMLQEPLDNGIEVTVNWVYNEEDEDALETGKDYEKLSNVPFIFSVLTN